MKVTVVIKQTMYQPIKWIKEIQRSSHFYGIFQFASQKQNNNQYKRKTS